MTFRKSGRPLWSAMTRLQRSARPGPRDQDDDSIEAPIGPWPVAGRTGHAPEKVADKQILCLATGERFHLGTAARQCPGNVGEHGRRPRHTPVRLGD